MKSKKPTHLIATHYPVRIAIPRLREILRKGDLITGDCKAINFYTGNIKQAYRVTHVDHWGVYAVPTDFILEKCAHYNTEDYKKVARHHKFKWQHINGIILEENKE